MGFAAQNLWSLVHPLPSTGTHYARVESLHYETFDTRTLTLRPGRGWKKHRAGQFVTVGVPVKGRITHRAYSISSAPERSDGCITITVKLVRGGRVSNTLFRETKPGDQLTITLADGDFTVPRDPIEPLLFITAGSGITPVMSMLRSFAIRDAMPDVMHVHYAPFENDVIFGAELARLGFEFPSYRYELITTRAKHARRFDARELQSLVFDWRDRETFACGPTTLLDPIEACFTEQNIISRLHVERFRPKLAAVDSNANGGIVRFGLSKKDIETTARRSLLEAAESAGVLAPHGCRMGICHTCDVTMKSGCVRDLRTGEMMSEPGARIQICVCAAAGDVEVEL